MADTAKRLSGPTQVTGSAVTQYTVPGATTAIVRHIIATNVTAAVHSITVSIGADASGTRIFDAVQIQPHGVLDWSGFLVLAAAEIIQALADAGSAVNLTISGVEVT